MSWLAGILATAVLSTALFPHSSFAGAPKQGQSQTGSAKVRPWADEVSEAIRPGGKAATRDVGTTGASGGGSASPGGGGHTDPGKGGGAGSQNAGHGHGHGNGHGGAHGQGQGGGQHHR